MGERLPSADTGGGYGVGSRTSQAAAPITGAIVLTFLPELLRGFGESRLMIYGLALTLVVLFMPGGIVQAWVTLTGRRR